jgi:hypothetical protein
VWKVSLLKKVDYACKVKHRQLYLVSTGSLRESSFKRYTVPSFGPRSAIERLFGDIGIGLYGWRYAGCLGEGDIILNP